MDKIPVNTATGSVIFWQNPDPQKWFDIGELKNLASLDIYFTFPNTRTPVAFNGLQFSVKLGILIERKEKSNNLLSNPDHVSKRIKL